MSDDFTEKLFAQLDAGGPPEIEKFVRESLERKMAEKPHPLSLHELLRPVVSVCPDTHCPTCGVGLIPEHAHMRCPKCGYRDSCCF